MLTAWVVVCREMVFTNDLIISFLKLLKGLHITSEILSLAKALNLELDVS